MDDDLIRSLGVDPDDAEYRYALEMARAEREMFDRMWHVARSRGVDQADLYERCGADVVRAIGERSCTLMQLRIYKGALFALTGVKT